MVRTYTSTLLILLSACTMGFAQEHKTAKNGAHDDAKSEKQAFTFINFNGGGYLGVRLDEVTAKTVTELKLPEERGAVISEVIEKSPAADAGLQKNDVVIWWNDTRVESATQLSRLVSETPAGRSVRIGVIRNGVERKITAKIGEHEFPGLPMDVHFNNDVDVHFNGDFLKSLDSLPNCLNKAIFDSNGLCMRHIFALGRGRLGVHLQPMSDQLGTYFGVSNGSGVLISDVDKDSPAATAGLMAGDVIIAIEGQKVSSPSDAQHIIHATKEGPIDLTVIRNKVEQHIKATLPKGDEPPMLDFHDAPIPHGDAKID